MIAKLSLLEVSESFYTILYEYNRASIRHLECINMLAYTRLRGTVSMRYRSSETNYKYEYRHTCIMVVC